MKKLAFAVMLAIGVIEELRRFAGKGISFGEAFALALFNTPASIYQILPLIMILSAITLFLGLAKSSELVVMRSAGRSGLRFLMAPESCGPRFLSPRPVQKRKPG